MKFKSIFDFNMFNFREVKKRPFLRGEMELFLTSQELAYEISFNKNNCIDNGLESINVIDIEKTWISTENGSRAFSTEDSRHHIVLHWQYKNGSIDSIYNNEYDIKKIIDEWPHIEEPQIALFQFHRFCLEQYISFYSRYENMTKSEQKKELIQAYLNFFFS